MIVKDIINVCNGKLLCGSSKTIVESFSKDTRTINNGDVYIAIKGNNFDGNDYVDIAFEKGASVAIVSKNIETKYNNKTIILVEDTIKAIGLLAKYKRIKDNPIVIAITGSVGKTTTKDLIYEVISKKYKTIKTSGNQNNNIGMPFTILNSKKTEVMVLEMGMNNLGEISYLSNIAKPNLSVITNVGTSHIGNLGSRENILKAKLEILDGMDEKKLIINNDNDMLHNYYLNNSDNIITVGIDNNSNYMAKINDKITFNNNIVKLKNNESALILDSLLAYAVGKYYNIDDKDIIDAIEKYTPESNRLNIINCKDYTVINDSYNASYDSMKLALSILSKYKTRKIAVLGDMLELGEFSKTIHKSVGLLVKEYNIDILLTVGKYSKYISDEALNSGFNGICKHFEINSDVIKYLKDNIKSRDVILVKASNSMKFSEIVNEIIK